jgi:hypothetical protein
VSLLGGLRPRRLLLAGALATAAGLAVAGTAPIVGTTAVERVQTQQAAGGVLVLAGWALLVVGIHRFGRAGSQGGEPIAKAPRRQDEG